MKFSFKNFLLLLAIILCIFTMATVFNGYGQDSTAVVKKHSDVLEALDEGIVESFTVESDGTTLNLIVRQYDADGNVKYKADGSLDAVVWTCRVSNRVQFDSIEAKAQAALTAGTLSSYDYEAPKETPLILAYLPYILIGIVLIILIVVTVRSASGYQR